MQHSAISRKELMTMLNDRLLKSKKVTDSRNISNPRICEDCGASFAANIKEDGSRRMWQNTRLCNDCYEKRK